MAKNNLICCVMGDLGSGKTLLMTALGFQLYLSGFNIISNYHLKFPYTSVDEIEDFDKLDRTKDYVGLLDEIHMTADSRQQSDSIQLSRKVLQSRKKNLNLFYSAQFIKQTDLRIRTVTNYILHPQILAEWREIPIVLLVERYKRNLTGDMVSLQPVTIPVVINGINSCYLYETREVVEAMNSEESLVDKYQYLINEDIYKKEMASFIHMEEGCSWAKAKRVVDSIQAKRKIEGVKNERNEDK